MCPGSRQSGAGRQVGSRLAAQHQSVSQHPRQRAHRDPGLGGTTEHNTQECHNTRQHQTIQLYTSSLSPVLELNIMVVVLSYDIDQIRSVTRSEMEIIRVSTKILVSTV